jgi:cation:H+ antiporter
MSDLWLVVLFVAGAGVSLTASWVLVSRLERVGARLGLSEALLGLVAALAADAPEVTAAITALGGHHAQIGTGVVIGSNVFNLAALLGFAAVVAGRIALHRRVIAMEGAVAVWIAGVCLAVLVGVCAAAVGLGLVLLVLVPYVVLLGLPAGRRERLGLPARLASWLREAVAEEEIELADAIHPQRGRVRDSVLAVVAVVVVVGASVVMEQTGSRLGARHAIPEIVVGGLLLAGVTSLPNAVAAMYLAARGRGAATLSTAMNSNALNVAVGLLLPATVVGLGAASGQGTLVAAWYLGLASFALAGAYLGRGLSRSHGVLIVSAYVAFAGVVVATAYASRFGVFLSIALPAAVGLIVASCLLRDAGTRASGGAQLDVRPRVRSRQDSLLAGWSVTRVWCLALAISCLIAALDAILGHEVILIGLLIAGPCCGVFTGRRAQTATAGVWAIALALILGLPDGIWGTTTHAAYLGAVIIAAIVTTTSAAILEHRR